jgi:hypothetical protein
LRILFDKNVPVGVRGFLGVHEVHTVVEMSWPPQLDGHRGSEYQVPAKPRWPENSDSGQSGRGGKLCFHRNAIATKTARRAGDAVGEWSVAKRRW